MTLSTRGSRMAIQGATLLVSELVSEIPVLSQDQTTL